jgi:hypothetical protein
MSGLEEATNGMAEVTNVSEWDKDHDQVTWRVEVPKGVTRFALYFGHGDYPVPQLKAPGQTVASATVVTGRDGLKAGDKIPVRFWWV